MSFDFDPNINLSSVQASHKTMDGGGGNTGYFQRNNSEENEEATFHFKNENKFDSFDSTIKIETEEDEEELLIEKIVKFFKNIINKIKKLFKK